MAPLFYRQYSIDEIKAAFDKFDIKHKGFISAADFQEMLKKMGSNYTSEDVKNMIKAITGGDDKISLTDFANLLT
jgi:Ca2+-binding EF-hand superfamily protein